MISIFHNQPLTDLDTEWIAWFSDRLGSFKIKVRQLARAQNLTFGNSIEVDEWLKINIKYKCVCNCSKCTTTITTTNTTTMEEDVEMRDLGPDCDVENEEKDKERKAYAKKMNINH